MVDDRKRATFFKILYQIVEKYCICVFWSLSQNISGYVTGKLFFDSVIITSWYWKQYYYCREILGLGAMNIKIWILNQKNRLNFKPSIYLFQVHLHWFYKSVPFLSVGHDRCKILPWKTSVTLLLVNKCCCWVPPEHLPCFGSQSISWETVSFSRFFNSRR